MSHRNKLVNIMKTAQNKIKPDLLIIVLFLIAMNLPLLLGKSQIDWDTFKSPYQEFYLSYNSLLNHQELPLWLPFTNFGMPDYFWLSANSITGFFFMGVGNLFKLQNVWGLFNFSLVFEQLIAVFGMYLLSGRLVRKRMSVFLVCISFIASFAIYRQIQFNFRMIYLLPFILYWIVRFFQDRNPAFFWLAGIFAFLAVPGSATYPLIISYYAVGLFFLVLLMSDFAALKALIKFSWQHLSAFAGFLLLAFLMLYYISSFGSGIEVVREGRGANLAVPISTFLTYWNVWNPLVMLGSWLYGFIEAKTTNELEYLFYFGLIPIFGFIASILYQKKSKYWMALFVSMVFLFAISQRGFIAYVVYYLPGVNLTRYIAILGIIPFRVFFLLLCGLGLDLDLNNRQIKKIIIIMASLFLLLDVWGLMTTQGIIEKNDYLRIFQNAGSLIVDARLFILRISGFIVSLIILIFLWRKPDEKINLFKIQVDKSIVINLIIILMMLGDIGIFRANFERKYSKYYLDKDIVLETLPDATPMKYKEHRTLQLVDQKDNLARDTTLKLTWINGWVNESYLQIDQCIPDSVFFAKTFEIHSESLKPLMSNLLFLGDELDDNDKSLHQIYACECPKLRVVTNVIVTSTDNEAIYAIKNADDLSNLLILSNEHSLEKPELGNLPVSVEITVQEFSHNQITVFVDLPTETGWLVYSDSYHPEWQATVNDESAIIERAYLGFKAIKLSKGGNLVEMHYGSIQRHLGYNAILWVFGTGSFLIIIGLINVILKEIGVSFVNLQFTGKIWFGRMKKRK